MRRADHVARFLLDGRTAPGDVIGVCLDRSADLIVALLGVLRAGCGYLPLDPEYPAARLQFMLEDSGAVAVVGRAARLAGMPADGVPLIDLAEALAARAAAGPAAELPVIAAGDLAYVIYTSGSTGTPKGVAVEHGNVARLFDAVHERIPVSPSDVWTWFHSVAFDFSVWEIWGALASGGELVVVGADQARDPEAFLTLLQQSRTTMLSQTPSAFHRLLGVLGGRQPDWSVRTVILGGEAVSVDALAPILSDRAGTWPRLFNLYGITEITVHGTVKELTPDDVAAGVRSPIGTPLRDLRMVVLDTDDRPVRPGEPGELWIGGAGVARGYVGRPELTAQRFSNGLPGEHDTLRWYRSGDLVRQLRSGELEYIGRMDRQVKIRGFRIELGEVESALAAHPAVLAAAVQPRDRPGQADRQLAAYLAVRDEPVLTLDEIREWLASRLPDYMIPSSFARVGALPLTPNGKIDRDGLGRLSASPLPRRPEAARADTAAEASGAASVEARLRSIWADYLGVTSIRGDDSFFAIGGDSMLALRVVAACKSAGIAVSTKDLYTHPTLASLAAVVTGQQRSDGQTLAIGAGQPQAAGERAGALPSQTTRQADLVIPASQMQCGVLFEAERNLTANAYHVVSAVRITSPRIVTEAGLRAALERLARDNIALLTSFDLVNHPRPMQVAHNEPSVRISYQDLSWASETERHACISKAFDEEDAHRFRRSDYPLWRVACVQTSPHDVEVMLAHHHAILDGWSVACFFDQLTAVLGGKPYQAAPASIHQAAALLEAQAIASAQDREFWRVQIASWEPLPVQRQAAAQAADGQPHMTRLDIDAALRETIRAAAASWGCAPKHLHLAAHLRTLAAYARWADHASTSLIVNARPEEPGADKALGMFLNLVPFSAGELGGSWSELARQVQAAEARIQPHRWFPLATMIKELGLPPLAVWFNYTDFSTTAMRGYLRHVREVSPTAMPLTVSVADDGLIVEASAEYFSAGQCAELAGAHLRNLKDAAESTAAGSRQPGPPG